MLVGGLALVAVAVVSTWLFVGVQSHADARHMHADDLSTITPLTRVARRWLFLAIGSSVAGVLLLLGHVVRLWL